MEMCRKMTDRTKASQNHPLGNYFDAGDLGIASHFIKVFSM
jgi:hypothetical protein